MDPTGAWGYGAIDYGEPQPQRGAGKPDFVTMNVGAKRFGRSPIGSASSGESTEWMAIMTKNLTEVAEGFKEQALRFSSP